jgi:cytochrome c-type biogenesis protein CcmH/NrfG
VFPHRDDVLEAYARGLEHLEAGDAAAAVDAFAQVLALNPEDAPSRLMLQRAMAAEAGAQVV